MNSDYLYYVISMKLKMNFLFVLSCPLYNQIRRVFLPNVDMEVGVVK